MRLSLVIVAYKNQDVLNECLSSIFQNNDIGKELEVIIIDNSPKEERVREIIEKNDFPVARYIESSNNGFGAGNNIGAKIATGDIIGFINPDIIFIEPIFSKIIALFDNDLNLDMCGVKLLDNNLKPTFSFYFDYKYSYFYNYAQKVCNMFDLFSSQNMYIAGADMFVRKSRFFEAGMFDENIFMYFEEPDLQRRLKLTNKNCKIIYFPQIHLIHLEGKSTPKTSAIKIIEFESAIYYGKKYNLDYRKKIKFELKNISIKILINTLLNNKDKELYFRSLLNDLMERYKQFL